MKRDWEKDMELVHHAQYEFISMQPRHLNTLIEALFYWLQQYAAEKERADKAEERAKELLIQRANEHTERVRMRQILEAIAYAPLFDSSIIELERRRIAADTILSHLYPKEEKL